MGSWARTDSYLPHWPPSRGLQQTCGHILYLSDASLVDGCKASINNDHNLKNWDCSLSLSLSLIQHDWLDFHFHAAMVWQVVNAIKTLSAATDSLKTWESTSFRSLNEARCQVLRTQFKYVRTMVLNYLVDIKLYCICNTKPELQQVATVIWNSDSLRLIRFKRKTAFVLLDCWWYPSIAFWDIKFRIRSLNNQISLII